MAKKKSVVRFRTEKGTDDFVEFDAAEEEDVFAANDQDDDDSEEELEDDDEDDDSEEELEDDDEEDDEDDEAEDELSGLRWGGSKKQMYGGDTADLEIGQDVGEAEEEEALAAELRARQLEALDADDFALDGDEEPEVEGDSLFAAMTRALDGAAKEVAKPEGLGALATQVSMAARNVQRLRPAIKAADDVAKRLRLVAQEQLSLMVCANAGFAFLLAAEGLNPATHPVMTRLLSLKRRLDGLEETQASKPATKRVRFQDEEAPPPVAVDDAPDDSTEDDDDDDDAQYEALPGEEKSVASRQVEEEVDDEDEGDEEDVRAYEAQAAKVRTKKAKKAATYAVAPKYGAWSEAAEEPAVLTSDGRRAASREIMQNRGLVPHRPRINRNPRVKKREKFRRAIIRRKGQVRDNVPENADKVNYGGEVTGIRAALSRSRRVLHQ